MDTATSRAPLRAPLRAVNRSGVWRGKLRSAALVRLGVLAGVLSSMLGGCTTPSLNPLASDGAMIADQGLIGSWSETLGNQTYVVTPTQDARVYRLNVVTHDDDSPTIEAELRVVKLGERTFADLSPTERQRDTVAQAHGATFVPAHCIVKFTREGDSLLVRELSNDWLKESLHDGKQVLTHTIVESELVITAPTSELQAFITRIADTEKAWTKAKDLKRLNFSSPKSEKAGQGSKSGRADKTGDRQNTGEKDAK